jgi:hypothetical protein
MARIEHDERALALTVHLGPGGWRIPTASGAGRESGRSEYETAGVNASPYISRLVFTPAVSYSNAASPRRRTSSSESFNPRTSA